MWQSLAKHKGAPAHHGVLSPFRPWVCKSHNPQVQGDVDPRGAGVDLTLVLSSLRPAPSVEAQAQG